MWTPPPPFWDSPGSGCWRAMGGFGGVMGDLGVPQAHGADQRVPKVLRGHRLGSPQGPGCGGVPRVVSGTERGCCGGADWEKLGLWCSPPLMMDVPKGDDGDAGAAAAGDGGAGGAGGAGAVGAHRGHHPGAGLSPEAPGPPPGPQAAERHPRHDDHCHHQGLPPPRVSPPCRSRPLLAQPRGGLNPIRDGGESPRGWWGLGEDGYQRDHKGAVTLGSLGTAVPGSLGTVTSGCSRVRPCPLGATRCPLSPRCLPSCCHRWWGSSTWR